MHSNRDYARVFRRQQKAAGRHVVTLLHPRHQRAPQEPRLGIMVPAKSVRTSVRRHQLKRWVRELFRRQLRHALGAYDCVVLFRCDPRIDHAALAAEITATVNRALHAEPQPDERRRR